MYNSTQNAATETLPFTRTQQWTEPHALTFKATFEYVHASTLNLPLPPFLLATPSTYINPIIPQLACTYLPDPDPTRGVRVGARTSLIPRPLP